MSGLDDAAKQSIVPFIQGAEAFVTQAMQRDIAAWLTKMAMVGDTVNPNKSVIMQEDRTWLKDYRMPPKNWEIWIGCYEGTNPAWLELGMFQQSGQLSLPFRLLPEGRRASGYIIATSIGLGRVFGLILGTGIDRISFDLRDLTSFLQRLWPTDRAFAWPPACAMSDNDARQAVNIIARLIARPIGPYRND
jgi:hypothetical protein